MTSRNYRSPRSPASSSTGENDPYNRRPLSANAFQIFKHPHQVNQQQQWFLDHLWTERDNRARATILQELAAHFGHTYRLLERTQEYEGRVGFHGQTTLTPAMNNTQLSAMNYQLTKQNEELKKENEKLKKINEDNIEVINQARPLLQTASEKYVLFPPAIPNSIKFEIFSRVLDDDCEKLIGIQLAFRKMMKEDEVLPGLALSHSKIRGIQYNNAEAQPMVAKICEEGLDFFTASIDLDAWEEGHIVCGVTLTIKLLFDAGMISRLIIHGTEDCRLLQPYWRLHKILMTCLKRAYAPNGFIDIEIRSILPSYMGGWYPEETKTELIIRCKDNAEPSQENLTAPGKVTTNVYLSLKFTRSLQFLQQLQKPYGSKQGLHLIAEETNLRIFMENNVPRFSIPWLNHIDSDKELTHHLRGINALSYLQHDGDYRYYTESLAVPDIDDTIPVTHEWFDEELHNVDNLLEY